MTVEDFDNLEPGDTIVSHNPIDGKTHRGKVRDISHDANDGEKMARVVITWDDKQELTIWRDELFTYGWVYRTFTVGKKV